MAAKPSSETEWTIHSLNIHGTFFERWCQKVILDDADWDVQSLYYPVAYPPPGGIRQSKESVLDVLARCQREDLRLTLLIECKKNNPDFAHWIFFPKYAQGEIAHVVLSEIANNPRRGKLPGWQSGMGIRAWDFPLPLANEARETRGNYLEHKEDKTKTKTSTQAISDAAYQITLATQAIVWEEHRLIAALGSPERSEEMPWRQQLFLPMIVTTAHLFTCVFDPGDVVPTSGEVPYEKVSLTERPVIIFEYPLPRHLQGEPEDIVKAFHFGSETISKMHIWIVNSSALSQVLDLDRDPWVTVRKKFLRYNALVQ